MPPPREAPPRVFEGIQGLLRQFDVRLSQSSGAGSAATGTVPLNSLVGGGANGGAVPGGAGSGALGGNGGAGTAGAKPPAGAGAGSAAGNGAGGEDGKLEIDEKGATKDPREASSGQKKGGGGKAPSDAGLTMNSLWWPICFFIDSSVSQDTGNSTVKGVVDMAAACGVTVVPFPVTARGFVNDPGTINSQQQSACNLTEVGLAPLASTTALVPFPDTAGTMCGETEWEQKIAVAGCAQKSRGGSPPAPSIEVPKGHNGPVAAHESMGHSQMDRPNLGEDKAYIDAGNGIGDYGGTPTSGGGGEGNIKTGAGWSAVGCSIMRANALPNTKNFAYDANRQLYYVKQENPDRQHDMGSGKKLFGDPKGPPPPGRSQIAKGDPPQDGKVGFDGVLRGGGGGGEAPVSRPPSSVNGGQGQGSVGIDDSGGALTTPKPGGRHDVTGGAGPSLADLRQKNPPKEPPRDDSFAVVQQKPLGAGGAPPSSFSSGGKREQLGFDESMTAAGPTSVVGSGGGSRPSGGDAIFGSGGATGGASPAGGGGFGSGGGGDAKLGFDETMTAKGPTSAVGTGGSPPKLFLGKGGGVPGTAFPSALSGDFFSKVSLGGDGGGEKTSERKRRNVNGAEAVQGGRPGRGAGDEGGVVRSVGRQPASVN